MYCEHCGAKNIKDAKFCEKCGQRIEATLKKEKNNSLKNKLRELPHTTKMLMSLVICALVIAIISLGILLNNPLKKIEDSLQNLYNTPSSREKELENIGKILKSNKKEEKILNKIKNTSEKITSSWVKNFNIEYKDKDSLKDSYNELGTTLNDVHNYFKNSPAIEYILNNKLYDKYQEELKKLYNSKKNYLEGQNSEKNEDFYYAYYYYQKVDVSDCYYKHAQNYINEYLSSEVKKLKDEIEKNIIINTNGTDEEILNNYKEKLNYIVKNKKMKNLDLSNSKEYQELYEDTAKKVVEYTKRVIETQNEDITTIIVIIDSSLKELIKDSNEYKELDELKKKYEDKMPSRLIDEYRISNSGSGYTAWKRTINGTEYDHNLHFSFDGKNQYAIYRLDKKYKRLKTKVVRGEDWEEAFSGYFIIYGDNKEIYKSEIITKNNTINEVIDLDITDVDNLKIEFVTDSKATGWSTYYIYLVEPYLYK